MNKYLKIGIIICSAFVVAIGGSMVIDHFVHDDSLSLILSFVFGLAVGLPTGQFCAITALSD